MRLNGVLKSKDGIDKVAVKGEFDPNKCQISIEDAQQPLVRVSCELSEGRLYLKVKWLNKINQPTSKRLLGIL